VATRGLPPGRPEPQLEQDPALVVDHDRLSANDPPAGYPRHGLASAVARPGGAAEIRYW